MKHVSMLKAGLCALAIMAPLAARAEDPELLVLDWAGFGLPGLMEAYKAKNGDLPTYSFYGDDDEAYQKVASGFRADVGHPCSQMIAKYRNADLIEPWDVSKIPEFANIHPAFLQSPIFKDDKGVWFIPTDYGFTAVAYNTDKVPAEDIASLDVFRNPAYAGRISLPDNTDDVWALALLATGVTDWTNVTDDQFAAAAAWLREVNPNVRAYWKDPSELSQLMAMGEVLVAWSWNDSVTILKKEGFPVGFQREPKEGVSSFFCGYVNFKNGPGKEDKAYDFINSWLTPASARALLDEIGYAQADDASLATIPNDELVAAGVSPIKGTVLSQTPIDPEMRNRMLEEFEQIKAGF